VTLSAGWIGAAFDRDVRLGTLVETLSLFNVHRTPTGKSALKNHAGLLHRVPLGRSTSWCGGEADGMTDSGS
jgi:hypothetical protein